MKTEEEIDAMLGGTLLNFVSYYKYSFSFKGTGPNGETISASFGGNGEDIYREDVGPTRQFRMCMDWRYIDVKDANGKVIFEQSPY